MKYVTIATPFLGIDPLNGDSAHMVNKPRNQWPEHGSKESRDRVNRRWAEESVVKGGVSFSLPWNRYSLFDNLSISEGEREKNSLPDLRRREKVTDGTCSHAVECGTEETGDETGGDEKSWGGAQ